MVNFKNKKGNRNPTRELNTNTFMKDNEKAIRDGVRGIKTNTTIEINPPGRNLEVVPFKDFTIVVETYGSPGEGTVNWAEIWEVKEKQKTNYSDYDNVKIKRTSDNIYSMLKTKYGESLKTDDRWTILDGIVNIVENKKEKNTITTAFKNINRKSKNIK